MKEEIKHICLAEDDPDDYYIFSGLLHEINSAIKLTWFQTCDALVEFLRAGSNLPCLIVLDMNMPKKDGHSCLVTIKKELELHHIPVIILSTAGSPATINMAYQSGAFKYFLKPYSFDDFRKIIREIIATPIIRKD